MAGDWIKMRGALLTNPKVIRVARLLIQDPEFMSWFSCDACDVGSSHRVTSNVTKLLPVVTRVTVGALLPLWSSVNDCAGQDGVLASSDLFDIDTIAGVPGFGRALVAVGWIEVFPNGEGVQFVNFNEHNTVGKERSIVAKTGAERTREYRERRAKSDAKCDVTPSVTVTSHSDHREEKKREEKKDTPITPKGAVKRFEEFWLAWPKGDRKQDKIKCEEKWRRGSLDGIADEILADIRGKRGTEKWRNGFVEAPLVYLGNRRWEDGNTETDATQEAIV